MIGYPLDSHVEYDEHNVPVFDRAITSVPLRKLIKQLFSDGIMPNVSTNMQVVAGSGMKAVVKAGFAICNGCLKLEEEQKTLTLEAADTSYGRIDTIVLRLDDNDNARSCEFAVIKGTASANPVRPALTRNQSVWELGLADIKVPKQSVAVRNDRITDTRYESSRCGVISSISEFDTTGIYQQVQSDLKELRSDEQAVFDTWFNSVKDQLGTDAAGNLLKLIEVERARINALASLKEGSTTGDAELQDIRVGVDGTTYASAGEAVRTQLQNIWTIYAAPDVEYSSSEIRLSDANLDAYKPTSTVAIGTYIGDRAYLYPDSYGGARKGWYVLHFQVQKDDLVELREYYNLEEGPDSCCVLIADSRDVVIKSIPFEVMNKNRVCKIEEDGYVYISGYYGDAPQEAKIVYRKTPNPCTAKATVGQVLSVAEVDKNGNPTKLRTIDQMQPDANYEFIPVSMDSVGIRKNKCLSIEGPTILSGNATIETAFYLMDSSNHCTFSAKVNKGDCLVLTNAHDLTSSAPYLMVFDKEGKYVTNVTFTDLKTKFEKKYTFGQDGTFYISFNYTTLQSGEFFYIKRPHKKEPFVLYAEKAESYVDDADTGEAVMKAIMEGRQIVVRVPNADGGRYMALYSPILMYQLPNYLARHLYLFYLNDGVNAQGLPSYNQLKIAVSRDYNQTPLS